MSFYTSTIFGGILVLVTVLLVSYFSNDPLLYFTPKSPYKLERSFTEIKTKPRPISITEELGSSMWCSNRLDGTKFCKFKNLYFNPKFQGHFLFFINEFSEISGVEDLKKLSLSTIQNHSGVYLKLVMIKSVEYLLDQNLSFINNNIFILKRFKSDNIMHVIHDDLLPLFITYKEVCSGDIFLCVSTYQLLLMDSNDNEPYYEWYRHFSVHEPIFLAKSTNPLCIKKGYFGLSNSSIWFQYGFQNTQGPVFESDINSFMLEEFSEFIRMQFGIKTEEVKLNSTYLDTVPILFFSRKINRKIINEDVLEQNLKNIVQSTLERNCTVINLDLSTHNSTSIIHFLKRSRLLVGMHGSAMILAIFMPPKSHIIELFPFGIQPEFVSPLQAMCQNNHVYYNYHSWVNTNEFNTRTHPEYPPLLGGILHLEEADREIIMNIKKVPPVECCHNPVYLFRMFQDTIVDNSFFTLFHKVVSNYSDLNLSKQQLTKQKLEFLISRWYFPPPVFNLKCNCHGGMLKLTWDYSFIHEGIEFSVASSNGILVKSKKTNLSLKLKACDSNKDHHQEKSVAVWVKAVDGEKESLDSFERCTTTFQDELK